MQEGRKEGDVLIIVMVCVLMVIDFQFFGIELCVGRESHDGSKRVP